jgi:hypothetical protein
MFYVIVESEKDGKTYQHVVLDHRGRPIASRDHRLQGYLLEVAKNCSPASWKDRLRVVEGDA